ncbi:hypothetical protein HQ545_07655 [Candidatus Woesearchaeota archaeon]|nr:hypothetical protein [Candidatus Woesearchaeota archaeon]
MKKAPSGIPGLDSLLYGGIPEGKSILISGNCGTGKTIFGAQFLKKGYDRGESCVFVTLEQSKSRLIEDICSLGIDFDKMMDERKLAVIGGPLGHISFFKEKTKATAEDIVNEIIAVVKETGASRLVLDSINLLTVLFDTEQDRRMALAMLASNLGDLNCTSLLISEVPEGVGNLGLYGFEDFVVDGVIRLRRDIMDNHSVRSLSVVKMRGSDIVSDIREMRINNDGVKTFPHKTPEVRSLF